MINGQSHKVNRALILLAALLTTAVAMQSYFIFRLYSRENPPRAAPEHRPGSFLANRVSKSNPPPAPAKGSPPSFMDPDDWFGLDLGAWDPFAEMARVRERMNRLFDESFGRFRSLPGVMDRRDLFTFAPEMDLTDDGTNYIVRFDIPGVEKANIHVQVDGRVLTVSGRTDERKEEKKGGQIFRTERRSGQFQRALTLPGPVDEVNMKAEYKDGVLTVTVPKKAAPSAKRSVVVL